MNRTQGDDKGKGREAMPNVSEVHSSDPPGRFQEFSRTLHLAQFAGGARQGLVTLFVWIGLAICRGLGSAVALLARATRVAKTRGQLLVEGRTLSRSKTATACGLYPDEDVFAPGDRCLSTGVTPVIYIYESEVRTIAGICALWGGLEAGGEYFGLQTRDGHIVICLVTGPGPNAIHEVAYFRQDAEFFRRVRGIIGRSYALEIEGFFHGHHGLGLSAPSSFDVEQLSGMARRNQLRAWSEIVASSVGGHRSTFRGGPRLNAPPWRCDCPRIRLKGFFYTDPQTGQKIEVPLRIILPGISPFRTMAVASGQLHPDDIGEYASSFPLESVVFDSHDLPESSSVDSPVLFERLAEQCRELPGELQKSIQFQTADGYVIVTLTASCNKMLRIFYCDSPPHLLKGVFLQRGDAGRPQDVTDRVPRRPRDATLKDICRAVL